MFHFVFSRISPLSPLLFSKQGIFFIVNLNYVLTLTNCVFKQENALLDSLTSSAY